MARHIVFIHGAFCGGWCFADIMPVFAEQGWSCEAPDLPYHVPGPKRTPDPALARQSVTDYTRDMAAFVGRLTEPPVIVGHSMGGLIAQQLAAQGLARALILFAPAPPWGVLPSTQAEMNIAKGLMQASPFWDKALNPSFQVAKGDSLASLDPEAQRRIFDMFSPESGRALFELFFWMFDRQRATVVDTAAVTCRCSSSRVPRTRSSPPSQGARLPLSMRMQPSRKQPAEATSLSWRRAPPALPAVAPIGLPRSLTSVPIPKFACARRPSGERTSESKGTLES
ncbi:MAG: alpha/beta hydrolase [Hyphomicrobium sp.]